MAYISIPSLNYNELTFNLTYNDNNNDDKEKNSIYISYSLHHYLSFIKEKINLYNSNWDYYKKITNPYEYIHTPVGEKNISICKHKPLSRSFFKMIEIINIFNLFQNVNSSIKSFHLAEGPGGFIEAFNYIRKNKNDKYYGMTLISEDINIPSWKKSYSFVNNNKNVILEYGKTKTGDLFSLENLIYVAENYKNTMDFITGDGGFDFSVDFNKQEDMSLKLIFSQIIYALFLQKPGGTFVIKIFDIFKLKTVECIFLLSNFYENICIYKPNTSRVANSEKYVICKKYKSIDIKMKNYLLNNFENILSNMDNIKSFFNIEFPKYFINRIEEINAIYGQQQLENINTTLNIIREYKNLNREKLNTINYINNNLYDVDNIEFSINKINHDNENNDNENNDNENNDNENNDTENNDTENNDTENNEKDDDSDDNFNLNFYNLSTSPSDNRSLSINTKLLSKISEDVSISPFINSQINKSNDVLLNKFQNKINAMKNLNIQKSINWCNKYELNINKYFIVT